MTLSRALEMIEDLPHTPASDMKKLGWRGVMKSVGRVGKVVITNHSQPEAVILSVAEYDLMLQALRDAAAKDQDVLDTLRRRFDERLHALNASDAGDRLRGVMRGPAKLGGKVKAGASH